MPKDFLFDRFFNSIRNESGRQFLKDDELPLAEYVYDVAQEEIQTCYGSEDGDEEPDGHGYDDDTISVMSFEDKIEAAMTKFDCVVQVFKKSNKSRKSFLESYDHWANLCQGTIESLKEFAEAMQTDKFNTDIARVVGGVVGALGGVLFGLSFLTPLAPVTIPLAIAGGVSSAVGGTVVAGSTGTELVLVKKRLEKVKTLIEEEQERFKSMAHWFTSPEELENAINSLIDYDTIKEVAEEVNKFSDKPETKDLSDDEFKTEFKDLLKHCTKKMNKGNNLTKKYGKDLAPVVITFVFVVCLMKEHNGIVLRSVVITQRLALGLASVLDFGVLAGSLIAKLAAKGLANAVAKLFIGEIFACLGIIIDVLNVVFSSIDLHKKPDTVHTKKIKEVAEKFEKLFSFIEGVYNETKKYKTPADESEFPSVIINHAPDDAVYADIRRAVRDQIPEEAWRKIKIRRLKTKGNNWEVEVPERHHQRLLQQKRINIKGKNCQVTG